MVTVSKNGKHERRQEMFQDIFFFFVCDLHEIEPMTYIAINATVWEIYFRLANKSVQID